jgi:hypothetical protein
MFYILPVPPGVAFVSSAVLNTDPGVYKKPQNLDFFLNYFYSLYSFKIQGKRTLICRDAAKTQNLLAGGYLIYWWF